MDKLRSFADLIEDRKKQINKHENFLASNTGSDEENAYSSFAIAMLNEQIEELEWGEYNYGPDEPEYYAL